MSFRRGSEAWTEKSTSEYDLSDLATSVNSDEVEHPRKVAFDFSSSETYYWEVDTIEKKEKEPSTFTEKWLHKSPWWLKLLMLGFGPCGFVFGVTAVIPLYAPTPEWDYRHLIFLLIIVPFVGLVIYIHYDSYIRRLFNFRPRLGGFAIVYIPLSVAIHLIMAVFGLYPHVSQALVAAVLTAISMASTYVFFPPEQKANPAVKHLFHKYNIFSAASVMFFAVCMAFQFAFTMLPDVWYYQILTALAFICLSLIVSVILSKFSLIERVSHLGAFWVDFMSSLFLNMVLPNVHSVTVFVSLAALEWIVIYVWLFAGQLIRIFAVLRCFSNNKVLPADDPLFTPRTQEHRLSIYDIMTKDAAEASHEHVASRLRGIVGTREWLEHAVKTSSFSILSEILAPTNFVVGACLCRYGLNAPFFLLYSSSSDESFFWTMCCSAIFLAWCLFNVVILGLLFKRRFPEAEIIHNINELLDENFIPMFWSMCSGTGLIVVFLLSHYGVSVSLSAWATLIPGYVGAGGH